jgi:hypothetical protein
MGRRNAQTSGRHLVPVPPLQAPRGLELIKSSAGFYANGAGVEKPAIQLSCPARPALKSPRAERTVSSPAGKMTVRAIAMLCLLLLVLPGLALAAIVWCGTRGADTGAPEAVVGEASSRLASSTLTRPNDLTQVLSNARSDIIIHKVKTERIDVGTWAERDSR